MLFGSNVPLEPHGQVNEKAPRYIFSCLGCVDSGSAPVGGNLMTVIVAISVMLSHINDIYGATMIKNYRVNSHQDHAKLNAIKSSSDSNVRQ